MIENQLIVSNVDRTVAAVDRIHAEKICTGADESRIHAGDMSQSASQVVIQNIAQINIQNIICKNRYDYNNGRFIPVFQSPLRAIACCSEMKPGTRRVLEYILGTVDEHNCIAEEIADIAANLGCSADTVSRAIRQLVSMQIICRKEGARDRSLYELTDKILNPGLAFKGNTKKLKINAMPQLLAPDAKTPLIPTDGISPSLDF